MLFSGEDSKRIRAGERRPLREAARSALSVLLGVLPVLLLFALPAFGQTNPNDGMYVLCSEGGTVPQGGGVSAWDSLN